MNLRYIFQNADGSPAPKANMQNVVFSWSEPSNGEIELILSVGGNDGFSVGMCFEKDGSSWYIVSVDGVTPQKWGEIPNDCIEKLSRLLTMCAGGLPVQVRILNAICYGITVGSLLWLLFGGS